MKNIILSFKIFLYFFIKEKRFNDFLTEVYLLDNPNLLKTKLKKIYTYIISFSPIIFIFVYDKIGFIELFLKKHNINTLCMSDIIMFVLVIISVLMLTAVVLVIYILKFISNLSKRPNLSGDEFPIDK